MKRAFPLGIVGLALLGACHRRAADTAGETATTAESANPWDTARQDTGPPPPDDGIPYACMRSVLGDVDLDRPYSGPPPDDGGQHNCRFWSIISQQVPGTVIQDHLVDLPNAIKGLGQSNDDGWGLGYFLGGGSSPVVHRGAPSAFEDTFFDDAVSEAAFQAPTVLVSHVRACSSGLCGIPDPHPFRHELLSRTWLMGHNGTVDKDVLLGLIDPDFLAANPPVNGTDASEWIDSELYFTLMLQYIEAQGGDVVTGLQTTLAAIYATGETTHGLNFFLSDGETLWAYRDGYSLYFFYDTTVGHCAGVASAYPTDGVGWWGAVSDYTLLALHPDRAPESWDLTPPVDTADTAEERR